MDAMKGVQRPWTPSSPTLQWLWGLGNWQPVSIVLVVVLILIIEILCWLELSHSHPTRLLLTLL